MTSTQCAEPPRGTSPASRAEFIDWSLRSFERFCGLIWIVPKSGVPQRFSLNDIQRAYCAARTPRDIVLKARQVGFTTLECVRDVYHLVTRPGANVLTICQSMTGDTPTKVLAATYRGIFKSLEQAGLRLHFRTEAAGEWELAGRNATLRITGAGASLAAAEKKGRGGTVSRAHFTETAYWEQAEATLTGLLDSMPGPELGTEVVSESTPNGASGVFYQQVQDAQRGASGYRIHFFPWSRQREYALPLEPGEIVTPQTEREKQNVELWGVGPEQLKWYRRKLAEKSGNQALMDQEFPSDPDTCFLVSGRGFFDGPTVAALQAKAREPIETGERGMLRIWQGPEPGWENYIISADPSEGTGGDPGAALVYRRDGMHCATLWGQLPPWEMARALNALGRRFKMAHLVVERINHGGSVLQSLEREFRYPRIWQDADLKPGWVTNSVSRPQMLDEYEDAVRRGECKTLDRELLREMRIFQISATGKPEAPPGEHDDLVMAGAIGWALVKRPVPRTRRDLTNLQFA